MSTLLSDLRYGFRMLAKNLGFTAVAVLTLALGIGANTAIFSVVNAVLLRPLPFKDPSRLVMIWEGMPQIGFPKSPFSAPDLMIYEGNQKSMESVGAFQNRRYALSGEGKPERVEGARVSATVFPMLGVQPLLGRTFALDDDQPGRNVVLFSYGLWQHRYGSDAEIVGRAVEIDRVAYTVVGVMPASFQFPTPGPDFSNEPAALWVPMAFTPTELQAWGDMFNNSVLARLRPGVTLDQARSEAAAMAPQIAKHYPAALRKDFQNAKLELAMNPFHDEVVGDVRTLLVVLLAAVGLVLLIACANVATLLLSRAVGRQKEIAIRSALGASRLRVLRQLLAESLLLGIIGGIVGWLIAFWGNQGLLSMLPGGIPVPRETTFGGGVFVFALLLSVAACLLFGAAPALLLWRTDLRAALHESGRSAAVGRRGRRLQGVFVTAEFALAVILVVGAGLLLKSFVKLLEVDPGFRPDHVLTMSVPLPAQSYPEAAHVRSFYQQALDRLANLAGVESAGIANDLPLHAEETDAIEVEGYANSPGSTLPAVHQTWVLGDYLKAMGIPLMRGRWFTPDDRQGSQHVALISASMSAKLWPHQDPIGKRIRVNTDDPWDTIVGVVGDVKDSSLGETPMMHTYTPYLQENDKWTADNVTGELRSLLVALRTKSDPQTVAASAESEIHSLDPDLAIADVHTMSADIHDSVAPQRFNTFLIGLFAGLAIFLAAIGIYGVISYAVTQQTHDIGVRLALGAGKSDVLMMVAIQGLRLVLPGVVIGVAGTFGLTRFLGSLLYGVRPTDAVTFGGALLLLTAVALAACYLPARRATKVDPMVALRYE